MKRRTILICIVVLAVLAAATTASAQAVRVSWTGTETLDAIVDVGVTTFPGNNMHTRGMVELLRADSTDARVTGFNIVVANSNLDADGHGPVWGTNHLDVDDMDGYWEGTWTGKIDEKGIALKMRGRGYGDLEGLLLSGTMVNMVTEGVIIELPSQ